MRDRRKAVNEHYDYQHLVTFGDTNAVGNVYFANYFRWQGECREALMAEHFPEFAHYLRQGYGLVTEFAHVDYSQEARLFDRITVRMTLADISRTRMEFAFVFLRDDGTELARGRQAVIWTDDRRRPNLMPEELYESAARYFGVTEVGSM
ncbi:MAG: acyl-CoA thioesterase [Candidatus Eisenbacteria bacterium]|nr:acyl-CoA thioesterase [Candidatus Eisenbacteria bacterium]